MLMSPFLRVASAVALYSSSNEPSFNANEKALPRIDSVTSIASTKWLKLQTVSYTDNNGVSREWDTVTRTTKQSSDKADAVVIIPLLRRGDSDRIETLLVEQYRPPIGKVVMSFPAGLIDVGETPEDAALRELREETGYVGEKCTIVSTKVCMSPGMSDASAHCVLVEVDLDNNGTPKAEPDEGEFIRVKRIGLNEGLKHALDTGSVMPHMGLYLFALGLELGESLG